MKGEKEGGVVFALDADELNLFQNSLLKQSYRSTYRNWQQHLDFFSSLLGVDKIC